MVLVVMGSDHAGYEQKEEVKKHLKKLGYEIEDLGTDSPDSVDYPDYAKKVSKEVVKRKAFGILICGAGIGMSMTANRMPGIRAALCHDEYTAQVSREHNDANILCMGGRVIPNELAKKLAEIFLKTEFSTEERHHRRVDKMMSC